MPTKMTERETYKMEEIRRVLEDIDVHVHGISYDGEYPDDSVQIRAAVDKEAMYDGED